MVQRQRRKVARCWLLAVVAILAVGRLRRRNWATFVVGRIVQSRVLCKIVVASCRAAAQKTNSNLHTSKLPAGTHVEALWEEDLEWYPGVIEQWNADGTVRVNWRYPDHGPRFSDCESNAVREHVPVQNYCPGDFVRAIFPGDGAWYNGSVEKHCIKGNVSGYWVRWDDPDSGPNCSFCSTDCIRRVDVFIAYKPGDSVEAQFADDGYWYPATVVGEAGHGDFQVRWIDADGGPEVSLCSPRYMRMIIVYKDYQVGDLVDAINPESGKWLQGFVGRVSNTGLFRVKWIGLEAGPDVSECRPEDMKGVFRDYAVGDAVEARCPEDFQWYNGVVSEHHGCDAFEVLWDDPGDGPVSCMCTPDDMALLKGEEPMEDDYWPFGEDDAYDDEFSEYEDNSCGGSKEEDTWEDIDIDCSQLCDGDLDGCCTDAGDHEGCRPPVQLLDTAKAVAAGSAMIPEPQLHTWSSLSATTNLRLTLSPKRRGQRRSWWKKSRSKLAADRRALGSAARKPASYKNEVAGLGLISYGSV